MSAWPNVTIADVARVKGLVGGPFGSKLVSRDYVDDGIPVIRGQNLASGRWVSFEDCVYVTAEKVDRDLRGNLAEPGDLVYTQRGTLGQVAVMAPDSAVAVISQSQMRLRVDAEKADPAYVYYWSSSGEFRQSIFDHAIVAGVPHINLGILGQLPLTLPPLASQRRIAAVLGGLDDLIENNRRRVEVLEEMARAAYRGWFVRFRFPGHEKVELVESRRGPIPDGWTWASVGDVAEIRRGVSWDRSNETDGGGTPVVTIPNLRARLSLAGCTELADVSDNDRLRFGLSAGDILLIGSNGNPERVGFAVRVPQDVNALFASFLMRARVNDRRTSALLLFHQLTDPQGIIASIRATAVGATGLRNLRINALRDATVLVPDPDTLASFDATCGTLLSLADRLGLESDRLAALRELLLPKLLRGQIDVSALDLDTLVEGAVT
jgi:type I restriction enzyme S subunit